MTRLTKNIKLLILNDDASDTNQIRNEIDGVDLKIDIQLAKTQKDFIKKIIRFEPSIVIASQEIKDYPAFEVYQDLRNALPFAFFILVVSPEKRGEWQNYSLTGIDAFIPRGNYSLLKLVVAQGFNKKHLEETIHQSTKMMMQSRDRLRSVFNNDLNAIFILNYKNEIMDLNPAAIEFLNARKTDELLGVDISKFVDKQDLKKIRTANASSLRGKKNSCQCIFSFGKKLLRYASINFIPMKNADGIVETVMMICKDITEAYILSERFKMNEDRFMQLADKLPVAIYYNDANGNCLFVNKKWCEYTGLTLQQSLGRGWLKSLVTEDRELLEKSLAARLNRKEDFVIEYRVLDRNGKITWLRSKTSPFIDDNGKLNGFVGSAADITAEKLHAYSLTGAAEI